MIAALLVIYGPRRSQDRLAIDLAWGAVVGALRADRGAGAANFAPARKDADRFRTHAHGLEHRLSQSHPGRRRPRRKPDLRLRRQPAREPCCRPARSSALNYAQHPLPAADKPVRNVGRGGRVARDVARGRHLRGNLAASASAPQRGPAANRLSGGAIGGRVSVSRRRDRRADLPVRAASPIATRSTCGRCWPGRRSGCSRRRWAGCTTRPSTRCADTRTPLKFALVRVTLTLVLGYLCAIPLPPAVGNRAAMGRGGPDRVGRSRRMGRICAAAMDTQSTHRMDRTRTRVAGAVVGARAGGERGRHGR